MFQPNEKSPLPPEFTLEDARAHLTAIIDSSDDAIISKNLDGVIQSWNMAAQRLFGFTAEEAVGKHITLIIPEDRLDEEFIIVGKIKEGKRVEHFETIRKRKDGKTIPISLTVAPIRNAKGVIVGASKIARDISAVKDAERISAYLAAIIDSSDDVIVSKDLDGIITSWNKSAERVFGYKPEEAIGQHIGLLIPDGMMDEEYSILGRVKAGQRVEHFQTIRRHKSGRLIDISLTVSPIRDKAGNIIGVSKIARDVTEQKRIEKALRESNQRKDEFLANISHELRTPMNAVVGLANILSLSDAIPAKEQKFVTTMKQSADGLLILINNLLDYSRLDSGSMEVEEIEFDLSDIMDKIAAMMNFKLNEKKIDLNVSYEPGMRKYLVGDGFKIQQIMMNLVSNAIKFTETGSVDVRFRSKEADDENSILTIEVADTGIGIAEDKLPTIFEKFVQADSSITRKYGGSGLGLAITKGFVEIMGGHIAVQSKPGLGTIFTVHLPVKVSEKKSLIEARPVHNNEEKNVLIVDDYEPNVIVISAVLDQFGYTYDVAEDGLDAVRFFQNKTYDVVLMDIQMHDMDGFESTKRMREIEKERNMPRTPIIAMTAHVQEKDKSKCLEAGMDDFVPKPFDLSDLSDKLKPLIPTAAE